MNIILVVFVFVILFVAQKVKHLDPVSNITLLLFNIYWLFALGISTMGVYNFFIPQTTTIIMLLCGVSLFNLGFYTLKISKYKVQTLDYNRITGSFDAALSNLWLRLVVCVTCVYVVYAMSQTYQLLLIERMSGAEIRYAQSEGTFDLELPFATFFSFIFPWLIPLVRVLFCYSILYRRNLYTLVLFVLVFMYSSLSFGRMMYIIALLPIVLIFGFFQSKNNRIVISRKQRLLFLSLSVALVVVLSFVSTLRLGSLGESSMEEGSEMVFSQVADYSSGAVVGFDTALKNNYVDRTGGFKYGMITAWPYMFPFTAISHVMGGYQYATGEWAYLSEYIERYYPKVRSDGGTWNGLFTWNMHFYADFGFWGILLFNYLFGLLMRYCIKRVYSNQSFLSVVICSIFFIMTVLSPTKLWGYENLFGVVVVFFFLIDMIQNKRKAFKPNKKPLLSSI